MAGQLEAEDALFTEIIRQTTALGHANVGKHVQAQVVRDLAIAFRAAAGGAQPGSVIGEKSS